MKSLILARWNFALGAAPRPLRHALFAALVSLCASSFAFAGTLRGTVKNGTTNQSVPGVEVALLRLRQGMEPVAKTKTDARGRFQFSGALAGAEPMLLQANYRGITYYQSVSPSDTAADIVVYENTSDPQAIQVASRAILFAPNGSQLEIEDEYVVQNQTKPPRAFRHDNATFEFHLPDGAQFDHVSTWSGNHMPTVQKTVDLSSDRKAIDWAFQPGKSVVRISYHLPYNSAGATIHTLSPYSITHVFLAVPPGVQIASAGFNLLGAEGGLNIYGPQSLAANAPLAVSVSGTPSAPPATTSQEPSPAPAADTAVSIFAGRFHNLIWGLGAVIAALLFIGTMFFLRKSPVVPATAAAAGPGSLSRSAPGKSSRANKHSSSMESDIDRETQRRLNEIKDQLFQLELRHQAGTIQETEYAQQRPRLEKILRDLLKN